MFPMLEKMIESRVFAMERKDGQIHIFEKCDGYFGAAISADELRALAAELVTVADQYDTIQLPDPQT